MYLIIIKLNQNHCCNCITKQYLPSSAKNKNRSKLHLRKLIHYIPSPYMGYTKITQNYTTPRAQSITLPVIVAHFLCPVATSTMTLQKGKKKERERESHIYIYIYTSTKLHARRQRADKATRASERASRETKATDPNRPQLDYTGSAPNSVAIRLAPIIARVDLNDAAGNKKKKKKKRGKKLPASFFVKQPFSAGAERAMGRGIVFGECGGLSDGRV